MLRVVLFWGIFLPLGADYSVDRAWNKASNTLPRLILSWGTAAYVVQVVFVYWFTVLLKSGPAWRSEGTALHYAFSLDYMATPIASFLLQFPLLLKWMTHGVFWFEIVGPLLLVSPFFTGPIRTGAVIGFCILHFGILATLRIGFFPAISIVSLLFFLPPWFWEKTLSRLERRENSALRIYYDETCEFCWKSVHLLKTFFLIPEAVIVPSQNDSSVEQEMKPSNSWVVEKEGERYLGSEGIPLIANASPILRPIAPILKLTPVRWINRHVYNFAARHRRQECNINGLSRTERINGFGLPLPVNIGIVSILVYLLFWNIGTLPGSGIKIPERFRFLGYILRIDQNWKMFAPYPPSEDGWYVIPAKLSNGTMVDLFRGGTEVDWNKPQPVSSIYKNHHWRKYGEALLRIKALPPTYAQYLCRSWNARHERGRRLQELEIFYIREWTSPNNEYVTPEKISLLKYSCPNG